MSAENRPDDKILDLLDDREKSQKEPPKPEPKPQGRENDLETI